jgi:signal transduction histidine kinase
MLTPLRSSFARYCFALFATALALFLRLASNRWLGSTSPLLFFAPAVMLSAWYGGTGPGLLCTVAGAIVADVLLLPRTGPFFYGQTEQLSRVAVFVAVGIQISWLSGALYAAKQRAEQARDELQQAHDELERQVQERTAELNFRKTLLESQSDASLDGILVLSKEGQVIFHNRRFRDLWQLPDGEIYGDLARIAGAIRAKLAEEQDPFEHAHRELTLRTGQRLDRYSAPVVSSQGESYGHVWFFRDVTEEHRLEREVLDVCEREQRRIGQDLHDGLGQHLTGLGLMCKRLEQKLSAKAPVEGHDAARIAEYVAQAVSQARELSRGLRPVVLAADGLAGGLRQLAVTTQQMSGLPCNLRVEGEVGMPDDAVETHLFRIAQEAVNNAAKHACATHIDLTLAATAGGGLRLSIEDDGIGFTQPSPPVQGMGLQIMRHRANVIGATLEIRRGNTGGTAVICSVAGAGRS